MGKKSRQKALRRELRPMMRAAVEKARADAQSALTNQVLVPQAHQPVSHQNPEPERKSVLVAPTPNEVRVVSASRG
jgi:hypothetical protein